MTEADPYIEKKREPDDVLPSPPGMVPGGGQAAGMGSGNGTTHELSTSSASATGHSSPGDFASPCRADCRVRGQGLKAWLYAVA